ncbi:MAG: hypothetical protein A2142_07590 [candidate division Zixibacteria bacterium RBG_16_48_11]|nr:MAG: hypothetical protein A2142_07590 [candidate division Zixibacteria bacterium RBG_16_48_11]
MDLASKIFDIVVQKDKTGDQILKWNDDEVKRNYVKLRLVSLLHDVGHSAFSHSGDEKLLPSIPSAEGRLIRLRHEDYSANIVKNYGSIRNIIDSLVKPEYGIGAEEIADFIDDTKPAPTILQLIVTGPLDADKMDYLWRDSYYTGVHYGKFDVDRLAQTLVVVEDQKQPSLGIDEDGILSAEGLILARYYMFLQVYFHDIRRAYDLHLTDYLQLELPNRMYPIGLGEYLAYDDYSLTQGMIKNIDTKSLLGKFAKIIIERKHYKPVHEVRIFSKVTAMHEARVFANNFQELRTKFPHIDFKKDSAEDSPNKFASFEQDFLVRKENVSGKDKYNFISYETGLVNNLEDFNILRLYMPDNPDFNNILDYIKTQLKWK